MQRLKRPNVEPVIDVAAMHSLEHIIATKLRNDPEWKDEVIYWGPMGCLTGFYIIVKGRPAAAEMYPIILEAFRHMSGYEGEVPGATAENCWACNVKPRNNKKTTDTSFSLIVMYF